MNNFLYSIFVVAIGIVFTQLFLVFLARNFYKIPKHVWAQSNVFANDWRILIFTALLGGVFLTSARYGIINAGGDSSGILMLIPLFMFVGLSEPLNWRIRNSSQATKKGRLVGGIIGGLTMSIAAVLTILILK